MMIEMPVTATKTYNQIISDDPSIEAGLLYAGYPSTTVQSIRDWFGTRNVCDDDNFKNFFLRLANPLAPKYLAQLRMETIDKNFDPLVENYLERAIEHGGKDKKTLADSTVTKTPAETTKTLTPAGYTLTERPAAQTEIHTPSGYTISETLPGYTKSVTPASYTGTKKPAGTTLTKKPSFLNESNTPASYSGSDTPASYNESFTNGTAITKSGSIERTGINSSTTNSGHDTKEAAKQLPMNTASGEITGGSPISGSVLGIGGMTWGTASSKAESTTKEHISTSGSDGSTETYDKVKEQASGTDSGSRTYTGGSYSRTYTAGSRTFTRATGSDGEDKLTVQTAGEDNRTYTAGSESLTAGAAGSKSLTYSSNETKTNVINSPGSKQYVVNTNGSESVDVDNPESIVTEYDNAEETEYGRHIRERLTGRAGLTPQQALTEAITYLRTISPAFFDLMMKLEPAFLGVYDL